jgi:hypothetical protein
MSRKLRSDSFTAQANSFVSASSKIEMPEGVDLSTDEQRMIWDQFTKTRAKDAWRDFDLVLLSKVVRLESDIRKYQNMLDNSGVLIKNKRETLVENPLIRVIDTLQRQQMAIIRSMSLNQTASDPRVLNATGKADANARNIIKEYGVESLIAMPQQAQ